MFWQVTLIVLSFTLLTACEQAPATSSTVLLLESTALPSQETNPQPDCDLNAVMSWEMVFQPTLTDDVEAAQRQRDAYAERLFPPCAADAQTHALAAYDAVIRAAGARAAGDDTTYAEAVTEHSAAQQRYFAAVNQLMPTQSPTPTVVEPILVDCPSLNATCSELTCAQAYACLAAGSTGLDQNKDGVPCESICR